MKIDLNGKWNVSSKTYQNFLTTVPGSVLGGLLENKLIEDPYYRVNEYEAKKISFEDFTFERDFALTKEQLKKTNFLFLDGLDTVAKVYVNDVFVTSSINMHIMQRVQLDNSILKENNHIKIEFTSPYQYVWNYPRKDTFKTYSYNVTEVGSTCLRKSNCMFGWDWGPNLGDMGIYRDIYIISNDVGYLENYRQELEFLENGKIKVNIVTAYKKIKDTKIAAILSLKQDGTYLKIEQDLKETNQFSFVVDNPKLWYPNGFGEQTLYDLEFVVEDQIDKYKVGLRKIKIDDSYDEWGRNLAIYVNGIKVFVKGGDYIPQDAILSRVNEERTRRLLTLCKDFNHNVIRVWGGGYYPDDYFFNLCDELGILVFEDLMFACGRFNADDEAFMSTVKDEVRQNVQRIRNHASLFLISGNNEIEDGIRGDTEQARIWYAKIFADVLPKIVKEETNIYYLQSSPTSGGKLFDDPNNMNYLDCHSWDVWHMTKPFEHFKTIYPRLLSEFGCQSMPNLDTVKTYAREDEIDLESEVMDSHQKNKACNFKILYYIENLYRKPRNPAELVYLSQTSVAEGIKMCVEHLRRNKNRCNGAIYWQLNDTWPGQSWSSIDYNFGLKALHYYSRRFYAPHLISIDGEETCIKIAVSNDTKDEATYIATYGLYKFNGELIKQEELKVTLGPSSDKQIFELENNMDDDMVLYVELKDLAGNVLSNNFYQSKKDKELHYKKPNLSVSKIDDKTILVKTNYYTKNIYLEPHDNECVLSDNYFSLLAGQEKIITSKKAIDFNKLEFKSLNEICE